MLIKGRDENITGFTGDTRVATGCGTLPVEQLFDKYPCYPNGGLAMNAYAPARKDLVGRDLTYYKDGGWSEDVPGITKFETAVNVTKIDLVINYELLDIKDIPDSLLYHCATDREIFTANGWEPLPDLTSDDIFDQPNISLRITGERQVFTPTGWVETRRLKVGDSVCVYKSFYRKDTEDGVDWIGRQRVKCTATVTSTNDSGKEIVYDVPAPGTGHLILNGIIIKSSDY